MLQLIESVIDSFRKCFSRVACFKWFVISVCALMLRGDRLGVTSFIRDLDLDHKCYEHIIHFFRSGAYRLSELRKRWYEIIASMAPIYRVNGRAVLIGDGVKQGKEALRMPGVKKMVQESETCSKPEYIHGHLFGAVGIVLSNACKRFCLPMKVNLQDGLKAISSWVEQSEFTDSSSKSHVEQMVESAFEVARKIGRSFLVLDRYFLSRPALELFDKMNGESENDGNSLIQIVTKAKCNCSAYRHPRNKKGCKGRPRKKGNTVKLLSLFRQKRFFREAKVQMYGEEKTISYYCLNLLWGQKLYKELRFVLVQYDGRQSILVSTDTSLDPLTIIEIYAVRFGIEELFREFKQQVGGFCYHFWSKYLPKLNHFAKKDSPAQLDQVKDAHSRKKILETIQAIETFVFCSSVAMGILQLIALDKTYQEELNKARYLRTRSNATPSEATVMYYLRKRAFFTLLCSPDSFVTQFIREKQTGLARDKSAKSTAKSA